MQQPEAGEGEETGSSLRIQSLGIKINTECQTCQPLTSNSEELIQKVDLRDSADGGCPVCSLFWQACNLAGDISGVDHVRSWRNGRLYGISLETNDAQVQESQRPWTPVLVLAADGETSTSPFPWLPTLFKSPFTRTALRDIQMTSLWIAECQQSHTMCQQLTFPNLPKRVLDVGSSDKDPYLLISSGRTGRYLCLSHRWGVAGSGYEQLCTTKRLLPHHCNRLPFGSLPLLFQHAVEITRALGIQYLWIDSLCILQDDIEDWEQESALMGDIFSNAYVTLFAERATHSNESLFQTEADREAHSKFIQSLAYQDPVTQQVHSILVASKLSTYPSSLEEAFCLVDRSRSTLEDRGWVLQEEVLSRRKICFSHTELHWQCNLLSQCECGLRSVMASHTIDYEYDFVSRLLLFHDRDGSVTKGLSKSLSSARRRTNNMDRAWQQLVRAYCLRRLTTEQDRLSALAGVASRLGRSSDDYLAGIWRQEAEAQLLWSAKSGRLERPCHRNPFYAPSWSWASVTGSVDFAGQVGYSLINLWKIEGGLCEPSGGNPLGPVSLGWLRVTGRTVPVKIFLKSERDQSFTEKNIRAEWDNGLYRYRWTRPGEVECLMMCVGQEENEPLPRGVRAGSLVTVDTAEDWVEIRNGLDEDRRKYVYLIAGLRSSVNSVAHLGDTYTIGLLIRGANKQPDCWERVCLVKPGGRWREWEKLTASRSITLV